MITYKDYTIARRCLRVNGCELVKAIELLPGFNVFENESSDDSTPEFELFYDENSEIPTDIHHQYQFETDGVNSCFSDIPGGYHLHMVHDDGTQLVMWSRQAEKKVYFRGDLTPQMFRFALWVAYGIMSVGEGRIPFHGSCIVNGGKAYIFLGESGTGKSTHTRLWLKNIEGSHLLNDDSPIISAEEDGIFIYGSPWSGKTPCYHQKRFPLGACVRLSQAPFNKIEKLSLLKAYAALHPSCPPEFAYDDSLYAGISVTLNKILSSVGVFHLQCLPDADAARLSFNTLTGNGK